MQSNINNSSYELLIQISDCIISGKSPEQVRRQWYRLWDCYKACRRRVEHTGGGDGNMRSGESSSQSGEGDNEDGISTGVGNAKSCNKKSKWLGATRGQYLHKVMDVFETSNLYRMIDKV